MSSAFKGLLKEYTIGYKADDGDSDEVDSVTGETLPEVVSRSLLVSFAPSDSDALIYREGANLQRVVGTVTCLEPVRFPDGTGNGTEFDMTFNGVEGKLVIDLVIVDDLEFIETALGQVGRATWQPLR